MDLEEVKKIAEREFPKRLSRLSKNESKLPSLEEIKKRIGEIDKTFEEATSWGSWMNEASCERRDLVAKAARHGMKLKPRYELKNLDDGSISD